MSGSQYRIRGTILILARDAPHRTRPSDVEYPHGKLPRVHVGHDDEAGALNYLQSEQVMRSIAAVRQGRTFTLQMDIGHAPVNPLVIK
ncbi:hypothetical protein [Burkholderia cenocepacia]|uniref:hypothetical protein n=1 Tax=Burkholderia cenocepacia TaxID=95486 RepID=UPI0020119ADD|nr:hypothetical protein [Burkholderia cenocepacia]